MYVPIRVPYRTDIPEPVLVAPPAEHLTSEGVYTPPSVRPKIRLREGMDVPHQNQLNIMHGYDRVRRWILPSWGWIGIRTYYGHDDAEWETFRRKVIGAYHVYEPDEVEKFRIIWIAGKDELEDADDDRTRT